MTSDAQTTDDGSIIRDDGHGRRWNRAEDRFLLEFGWCIGVAFVARHDLGRSEVSARKRLTWLRKHKPDMVARYWNDPREANREEADV